MQAKLDKLSRIGRWCMGPTSQPRPGRRTPLQSQEGMVMLWKRMGIAAVSVLGCCASPAWAYLLPAGTWGFNYDFSALTPAPSFDFFAGPVALTSGAHLWVYDQLDGAGDLVVQGDHLDLARSMQRDSRIRDGRFSVVVSTAPDAAATFVADLSGCKGSVTHCTSTVSGTPFSVPEPGSLALVCLGGLSLFAAAGARRRT